LTSPSHTGSELSERVGTSRRKIVCSLLASLDGQGMHVRDRLNDWPQSVAHGDQLRRRRAVVLLSQVPPIPFAKYVHASNKGEYDYPSDKQEPRCSAVDIARRAECAGCDDRARDVRASQPPGAIEMGTDPVHKPDSFGGAVRHSAMVLMTPSSARTSWRVSQHVVGAEHELVVHVAGEMLGMPVR